MIISCKHCGKEFMRSKFAKRHQFCSDLCATKERCGKHICQYCGDEYYPKAPDRTKFCSRKCFQLNKKEKTGFLQLAHDYPSYILNGHGRIKRHIKLKTDISYCSNCSAVIRFRSQHCTNCRKEVGWISSYKRRFGNIYGTRKCKQCGKDFEKEFRNKRSVFCSTECSDKYSRREQRKKPEYRAKHGIQKRARKNKIKITAIDGTITVDYLGNRDGWKCGLCRKNLSKKYKNPHPLSITIDHIIPLSMGGQHTKANTQLAHNRCNYMKGNKNNCCEQLMIFG